MVTDRPRRPRLLFVVSADFGELFNACYLVHDTGLDAAFAMPPRLFALNQEDFAYPARAYRTAADIQAAVERERPDLVLLFSGYLFAINGLLDLPSLGALVEGWRRAGVRVATSDPFVGVMARVDDATIDARHPQRAALARQLGQAHRLLADVVHVYLAPIGPTPHPRVSFHNPALGRAAAAARAGDGPPRWLYVLSPEDWALQATRHGPDAFAERLARLLAGAVSAGREPVLVAPAPCLEAVRARAAAPRRLAAHDALGYTVFMGLLTAAEYVFYWNAFSGSILARLLRHGPFFPFGLGHLAHAVKPFRDAAANHFYPGCRLPLLDDADPPAPARLAELAEQEETEIFGPACANFARAPTSLEAVAALLDAPAPPPSEETSDAG